MIVILDSADSPKVASQVEARAKLPKLTRPHSKRLVMAGIVVAFLAAMLGSAFRYQEGSPRLTEREAYLKAGLDYLDSGLSATGQKWQEARNEMLATSRCTSSWMNTYKCLDEAAKVAGGDQSLIMVPISTEVGNGSTTSVSSDDLRALPTVDSDEGIGTIRLPSILGWDEDFNSQYAVAGAQAIQKVARAGGATKGWVVDLRGHTGGQFGAVVGAILPLLKQGPVVSWVYRNGSIVSLIVEGRLISMPGSGDFCVGTSVGSVSGPVVVLMDQNIGSAAETAALALNGSAGAVLVGQPSAGRSTLRTSYTLEDGAELLVAEGRIKPLGKPMVKSAMLPDVLVDTNQEAELAARDMLEGSRVDASTNGPTIGLNTARYFEGCGINSD